jgi:SAM-dependent methyltransferase
MSVMVSDAKRDALERLQPYVERARSFSGWAFPDMRVRLLEDGPPWDYEALVREYAGGSTAALDLGTGGGEFVARLRDALPARTVVTEEWEVNAPVAHKRLAPLGVAAVRCRSLSLPFADEAFDLVFDRHEELDPAEVARVLAPGGCLVTQQVGRTNWQELQLHFPRMTDFGDIRGEYAYGFASAALTVVRNESHDYRVAYESLGDIVFMLLVAPWTIPDFTVERDLDALLALEERCTTADGLVMTWSRFLLIAEKPR